MAVEIGTTLEDLQETSPLSGDPVSEGDNHIRLIKQILKDQFPGAGGNGFNIPITATEVELNHLSGITSNVQDQIDAITTQLYAPAGTALPFYNTAPPAGWVQDVLVNDSMLRVVSGAGGSGGGSDSPISFDMNHVHSTSGHILTEAEMPIHTHGYKDRYFYEVAAVVAAAAFKEGPVIKNAGLGSGDTDTGNDTFLYTNETTESAGSGVSHDHGDTGAALGTFTPKYSNVIIGVKS